MKCARLDPDGAVSESVRSLRGPGTNAVRSDLGGRPFAHGEGRIVESRDEGVGLFARVRGFGNVGRDDGSALERDLVGVEGGGGLVGGCDRVVDRPSTFAVMSPTGSTRFRLVPNRGTVPVVVETNSGWTDAAKTEFVTSPATKTLMPPAFWAFWWQGERRAGASG